jgi:hypothetical protein
MASQKNKTAKTSEIIPPTELTKRPPRSPRVRLGGYVILARCLDKGRAAIAGRNGEYSYACPLDQRFLTFAGVNADQLKKQLAAGKSDGEILQWIKANTRNKRSEIEIAAWSAFEEARVPSQIKMREFFQGIHSKVAPHREDIVTWFDLLDLDDYASFGGKP